MYITKSTPRDVSVTGIMRKRSENQYRDGRRCSDDSENLCVIKINLKGSSNGRIGTLHTYKHTHNSILKKEVLQ